MTFRKLRESERKTIELSHTRKVSCSPTLTPFYAMTGDSHTFAICAMTLYNMVRKSIGLAVHCTKLVRRPSTDAHCA